MNEWKSVAVVDVDSDLDLSQATQSSSALFRASSHFYFLLGLSLPQIYSCCSAADDDKCLMMMRIKVIKVSNSSPTLFREYYFLI